MTESGFLRAISQFADDDIYVIEFDNGQRLIVEDQKMMLIRGEFVQYIETEFVSNYFEVGSVTRVMGWESLPGAD